MESRFLPTLDAQYESGEIDRGSQSLLATLSLEIQRPDDLSLQ